MQKFYKIITFGCQMNVHESEKLAGTLESLGYIKTEIDDKADVVVFNTCAIRQMAEDKALGNIGAFKPIKAKKKDMIIAVCGCMSQQLEKANYIKKTFPFVNIIFGTHNLYEFKDYLMEYEKSHKKIFKVWGKDKDNVLPIESESKREESFNAYVNINYGCNNFCTYCIVPYVRGRERSRNFDDIVNECKDLVSKGYKSITLLGQNVNSYGKDFKNEKYTFANLINEVCKIEGDFVLNFMSSHPRDLTSDIIDAIKDNPKMSRAIHLPVQSGSSEILKAMNRHHTKERYLEIVKEIREKIPNATISTDMIVGFPGETEKDFEDTIDLIKQVKFSGIFAFIYSKRKGTPAEKMENQVPLKVKHERIKKLLEVQKQIQAENRKNMIGKTYRVLITGKDEKTSLIIGKLDHGTEVLITNCDNDKLRYEKVKITKDLKGFYGELLI